MGRPKLTLSYDNTSATVTGELQVPFAAEWTFKKKYSIDRIGTTVSN